MNEDNNQKKYEAVIGLEIHAELKTNSKMFCGCSNIAYRISYIANGQDDKQYAISGKPNSNICPVCLGMPGTLPVINKQAVKWTILTGLALNCKINKFTKWDRKNYFYPDLPKGYQISQYDLPLVYGGYMMVENRKIRITRIHLEEDTGTSKHPEGRTEVDYSLLDFNRAGVPLMELVTEPDIRSAKEAKEFCQQYQQVLRNLEIADADMEKGQMRCEVNISIRKYTDKSASLGTKVEIKNLNSFKSVHDSIQYEKLRQEEILESGEKIIQETRGWDEKRKKTYVMRTKETSADYRYFPEPDLPPITFTNKEIQEIDKKLPELPEEKAKRYIELAVSNYNAFVIASDIKKSKYLDNFIKIALPELVLEAANWIVNIIPDLSIKEEILLEILELENNKKITRSQAKDMVPEIKKGKTPNQIIKEKGLEQIFDTREITKIVDKIIKNNPEVVAKIKSGKTGVMGFLVGQVMKETKGRANPKIVNEILRKKTL